MGKETLPGSRERAADRGRDELFDLNIAGDNPLASLEVTEAVVRQFASDIVGIRVRYNSDKITDVEARAQTKDAAQRYADIFMGKSSEYSPSPWNSAEQLGVHLSAVLSGNSEPDVAARDFLLYVASELLTLMAEFEADKIDEEVAHFRTDCLIEDAVRALMGLPAEEQPEDDS